MTTPIGTLPGPHEVPDRIITTREGVIACLAELDFSKSCIDMGWAWEVIEVINPANMSRAGFHIRTTFRRPDRDPPHEIQTGLGGEHCLPNPTTETAVVKRAFVACLAILQHELMEAVKWRGYRPLDPHNTIQELIGIQVNKARR